MQEKRKRHKSPEGSYRNPESSRETFQAEQAFRDARKLERDQDSPSRLFGVDHASSFIFGEDGNYKTLPPAGVKRSGDKYHLDYSERKIDDKRRLSDDITPKKKKKDKDAFEKNQRIDRKYSDGSQSPQSSRDRKYEKKVSKTRKYSRSPDSRSPDFARDRKHEKGTKTRKYSRSPDSPRARKYSQSPERDNKQKKKGHQSKEKYEEKEFEKEEKRPKSDKKKNRKELESQRDSRERSSDKGSQSSKSKKKTEIDIFSEDKLDSPILDKKKISKDKDTPKIGKDKKESNSKYISSFKPADDVKVGKPVDTEDKNNEKLKKKKKKTKKISMDPSEDVVEERKITVSSKDKHKENTKGDRSNSRKRSRSRSRSRSRRGSSSEEYREVKTIKSSKGQGKSNSGSLPVVKSRWDSPSESDYMNTFDIGGRSGKRTKSRFDSPPRSSTRPNVPGGSDPKDLIQPQQKHKARPSDEEKPAFLSKDNKNPTDIDPQTGIPREFEGIRIHITNDKFINQDGSTTQIRQTDKAGPSKQRKPDISRSRSRSRSRSKYKSSKQSRSRSRSRRREDKLQKHRARSMSRSRSRSRSRHRRSRSNSYSSISSQSDVDKSDREAYLAKKRARYFEQVKVEKKIYGNGGKRQGNFRGQRGNFRGQRGGRGGQGFNNNNNFRGNNRGGRGGFNKQGRVWHGHYDKNSKQFTSQFTGKPPSPDLFHDRASRILVKKEEELKRAEKIKDQHQQITQAPPEGGQLSPLTLARMRARAITASITPGMSTTAVSEQENLRQMEEFLAKLKEKKTQKR